MCPKASSSASAIFVLPAGARPGWRPGQALALGRPACPVSFRAAVTPGMHPDLRRATHERRAIRDDCASETF